MPKQALSSRIYVYVKRGNSRFVGRLMKISILRKYWLAGTVSVSREEHRLFGWSVTGVLMDKHGSKIEWYLHVSDKACTELNIQDELGVYVYMRRRLKLCPM